MTLVHVPQIFKHQFGTMGEGDDLLPSVMMSVAWTEPQNFEWNLSGRLAVGRALSPIGPDALLSERETTGNKKKPETSKVEASIST